jgi:hypothetical protein
VSEDRSDEVFKLLTQLAESLNECQKAGLRIKLKHDVVYTGEGYVLPIKNGWVARTLLYTEWTPTDDSDDDD